MATAVNSPTGMKVRLINVNMLVSSSKVPRKHCRSQRWVRHKDARRCGHMMQVVMTA